MNAKVVFGPNAAIIRNDDFTPFSGKFRVLAGTYAKKTRMNLSGNRRMGSKDLSGVSFDKETLTNV